MKDFVTALGLVLVIEGLLYAFAPDRLKRMMVALQDASPDVLRGGGLVAMAIGVAVVWLSRTFLGSS